jgi:hypothetical protein
MTTYDQRLKRIKGAVALETVDKVPFIPCGTAFNAKACGVKLSDYLRRMSYNCTVNIRAAGIIGGIDGIQFPIYSAEVLPLIWLSEVEVPGRSKDLPDNEVWQVTEKELVKAEDYDQILSVGFTRWFRKMQRERLGNPIRKSLPYFLYLKRAVQRMKKAGYVCLTTAATATPFEMFCGGRSLESFFSEDLMGNPDKLEAVFRVTQPVCVGLWAKFLDIFKPLGMWIGGWRGTPAMVSPGIFERFCWPYMEEMANLCISKGVIPVFHLDSCWDNGLKYFTRLPKGKCIMALDGTTDIRKAKETVGNRMCIMGDVPASLLANGAENEVFEYCNGLIRDIGPTGFILSSGCDAPFNAKLENVRMMSAACR